MPHIVEEHPEGWAHVSVSGVLDEHAALDSIQLSQECRTCLMDVSAVSRLNSSGVRDWMTWLQKQQESNVAVILIDCSKAVVGQLNLNEAFGRYAQVFSVCIPYFCEPCELEQSSILLASDWTSSPSFKIPKLTCGNCESPMVFDDIEGMYFRFAKWARMEAELDWVSTRLAMARQGDMDQESAPMIPAPTAVTASETDDLSRDATGTSPIQTMRLDVYYYLAVGALVFLLAVVVYHLLKL